MLVLNENLGRCCFADRPIGVRNAEICQSAHIASAFGRHRKHRQLGSLTMIILQDAAESLAAMNLSVVAANFIAELDDVIGQPLMIAFLVIMSDEISHGVSQ